MEKLALKLIKINNKIGFLHKNNKNRFNNDIFMNFGMKERHGVSNNIPFVCVCVCVV
jgi:hypothetical protein